MNSAEWTHNTVVPKLTADLEEMGHVVKSDTSPDLQRFEQFMNDCFENSLRDGRSRRVHDKVSNALDASDDTLASVPDRVRVPIPRVLTSTRRVRRTVAVLHQSLTSGLCPTERGGISVNLRVVSNLEPES